MLTQNELDKTRKNINTKLKNEEVPNITQLSDFISTEFVETETSTSAIISFPIVSKSTWRKTFIMSLPTKNGTIATLNPTTFIADEE